MPSLPDVLPTIIDSASLDRSPDMLHALCFVSRQTRKLVLLAHPVVDLMVGERKLAFDGVGRFPFQKRVCEALEASRLDCLHTCLMPEVPPPGVAASKGQWRHIIQQRWKAGGLTPAMMTMYREWVRQVVGPLLRARGETHMYYSRLPLLRYHTPWPKEGEEEAKADETKAAAASATTTTAAAATAAAPAAAGGKRHAKRKGGNRPGISTKRHTDGSYGHPRSEINVWLPLCDRVWGANSLWRDASPWAGPASSRPFEMRYGEAVLWYGVLIPHETVKNTTEATRCSFDFRVIPGSLANAACEKPAFKIESDVYWDRCDLSGKEKEEEEEEEEEEAKSREKPAEERNTS